MKTVTKIGIGLAVVGAGVAATLLMCCGGPAALKEGELTDTEEMRRLDKGEILITQKTPTGGQGVAATAKGVIAAPVDKVWPAVRDCQHFKDFMPRTTQSELRKSEGDKRLCFVVIDMPWPISDLEAETESLIERGEGTFKRTWKLTKGTYKHNNGSWFVEPFKGDPNRTLLTYNIDVNPDMSIPDAILKKAQTGSLPDVFKVVGKRAGAPDRPE